MYIHVHVRTCMCIFVMCACTCTCMYVCVFVRMYMYSTYMYACMYVWPSPSPMTDVRASSVPTELSEKLHHHSWSMTSSAKKPHLCLGNSGDYHIWKSCGYQDILTANEDFLSF